MKKQHVVVLDSEERQKLIKLISSGTAPARKLTRARILLKADNAGDRTGWTDKEISEALDVSLATVWRIRRRFAENDVEDAINRRKPCKTDEVKVDNEKEEKLVALAYSSPPEGRDQWSLRLLAKKFTELQYVDTISHETVRTILRRKRVVWNEDMALPTVKEN